MKFAEKTSAVSPIVATLVLIVVAVVGAVAVGTIMGTFSSDVSKQTDTGAVGSASQTEILTGGSTTVQPASEQMAKVYMAAHPGIKITVTGGGSGAGVAQTGSGVLDIGASSDLPKITTAQADHPDWDLRGYQIGGSAVVFIANQKACTGKTDLQVSAADLKGLYDAGTAIGNLSTVAEVYQRADSSGTEETAAKWMFGSSVSSLDAYTAGGASKAANGNAGVYAAVKDSANAAVGFVDMGFAMDGAGNALNSDKIVILNITPTTQSAKFQPTQSNIKDAVKIKLNNPTGISTKYDTGLARGLYYMTKGEPNSVVKNYLSFAQAPTACDAMHLAGVFCNADVA